MSLIVGTNSYADVDTGNAYFEDALHADEWNESSDKDKALVTATRMIDRQSIKGTKTSEDQELEFPRDPDTEVPADVITATLELSLALIKDKSIQDSRNTDDFTKSIKAGSAEIVFFRGVKGPRFPTIVQELLGPWLSSDSTQSGPFVSGSDNESKFSDTFDLNRGI